VVIGLAVGGRSVRLVGVYPNQTDGTPTHRETDHHPQRV